jgi:hypothetical protein
MPYGGAWNIKNLCDSSLGTRVWAKFYQNLNPLILVLSHFFQIHELLDPIHLHATYSPMLKTMWVQSFNTNQNKGVCKYGVEQLINN